MEVECDDFTKILQDRKGSLVCTRFIQAGCVNYPGTIVSMVIKNPVFILCGSDDQSGFRQQLCFAVLRQGMKGLFSLIIAIDLLTSHKQQLPVQADHSEQELPGLKLNGLSIRCPVVDIEYSVFTE